jgi:hypothetical protein
MANGSLTKPRAKRKESVEERALRAEVETIKRSPNPFASANSRIATAAQEIKMFRANARAKYYEHDDKGVREEYAIVAQLARKMAAIAGYLAGE